MRDLRLRVAGRCSALTRPEEVRVSACHRRLMVVARCPDVDGPSRAETEATPMPPIIPISLAASEPLRDHQAATAKAVTAAHSVAFTRREPYGGRDERCSDSAQ